MWTTDARSTLSVERLGHYGSDVSGGAHDNMHRSFPIDPANGLLYEQFPSHSRGADWPLPITGHLCVSPGRAKRPQPPDYAHCDRINGR